MYLEQHLFVGGPCSVYSLVYLTLDSLCKCSTPLPSSRAPDARASGQEPFPQKKGTPGPDLMKDDAVTRKDELTKAMGSSSMDGGPVDHDVCGDFGVPI